MPEETQSPGQQTPPKEAPKSTSHKINWLHILIGVIIGVILLGAGFGVYFLTQSKSESTNEPTKVSTSSAKQATPSATATSSAKKDETEDWKVFKDEELGITFKYPNTWSIKLPNTDPTCGKDVISVAPKDEYLGTCGSGAFPMLYIKPPSDSRTGCNELQDPEKVTVDDKETNKCETVSEGPSEQNPGANPKGTKRISYDIIQTKFSLWYTQYPSWPKHEEELEQIVSTFKFLD